jgi:hypothetical protein
MSEYKEIISQLTEIEKQIARMEQKSLDGHVVITRLLEKHEHTLYGNGSQGITTRIDRLEISDKNRVWHFRAVWLAATAGIVKLFFDIFSRRIF